METPFLHDHRTSTPGKHDRDPEHFRWRLAAHAAYIDRILPCFEGKVLRVDGSAGVDEVYGAVVASLLVQNAAGGTLGSTYV